MTAFEPTSDIECIRAKIEELMEDLGPEAVTELTQSFVDESPDTFTELQKHTSSTDFQKLRLTAHSFKSIAQIYGLQELGVLAERIEKSAQDEIISDVPSLLGKMEEVYKSGTEYLIQHLESAYRISLKNPE